MWEQHCKQMPLSSRLHSSIIRYLHAFVMLTCGLSVTARGEDRIPIESLAPGKKIFSIGVFSDNGGGSPGLTETLKVFRDRIKPLFFIGVGDHFGSKPSLLTFEKSMADAYGSTDVSYQIFYPVIDGENRFVANRPGDALNWGWFERCKIAMRDGTILRDSIKMYDKTHGDYMRFWRKRGSAFTWLPS